MGTRIDVNVRLVIDNAIADQLLTEFITDAVGVTNSPCQLHPARYFTATMDCSKSSRRSDPACVTSDCSRH